MSSTALKWYMLIDAMDDSSPYQCLKLNAAKITTFIEYTQPDIACSFYECVGTLY